jgi:uncharacterized phage infection (PIP) family protein YhgE
MGFWEKVLPGYRGYREREDARNTDKLLREHLTARLRESRNRYDDFKAELTGRGNLDLLGPAEKVTQTLGRVSDRLRYANHGFSGRWFGQKIGAEELQQVLDFDKQLATAVDEIDLAFRSLQDLDEDGQIQDGMNRIVHLLRDMEEGLNEREQILRTLGGEATE